MVSTIVHSQSTDLMNEPKFKETESWHSFSKIFQNETKTTNPATYFKQHDNATSSSEQNIDSKFPFTNDKKDSENKNKQKEENLDNEENTIEKVIKTNLNKS